MSSDKAWNMYVFRDGRNTVAGATLARELAGAILAAFEASSSKLQDALIDALLRAGELECALVDAGLPAGGNLAEVTDALADCLVRGELKWSSKHLLRAVPQGLSEELRVSPPEGFAYYALHPLDYSDMAAELPLTAGQVCIVGIRSIGVTLSAIVAAAIRRRGLRTTRLTVRPTGHPYNRMTEFIADQRRTLEKLRFEGAEFVVVDEGPGMSGSSFLSVGESLEDLGVARKRIAFLCSRVPDPDSLRASNGGERWRRFRAHYSRRNWRLPANANLYIGGGEWREFLMNGHERPATWTQMERLKFMSDDRKLFLKFEGFGRYGSAVVDRARRISKAGFGPTPLEFAQGFAVYPAIVGRPSAQRDLGRADIERMAAYCAFRASELRSPDHGGSHVIETMARFNIAQEFGTENAIPEGALSTLNPVLVDGRMNPHEWLLTDDGELLKTDNASHGDDHFFPGPTDIAWDLAGAIVEWNMDEQAAEFLIDEYRRRSGDNVGSRIGAFLLAYSVFRLAYCKMAAAALNGSGEEEILTKAYQYYRAAAGARLGQESEPLAA